MNRQITRAYWELKIIKGGVSRTLQDYINNKHEKKNGKGKPKPKK
jgi:hypothetical protein